MLNRGCSRVGNGTRQQIKDPEHESPHHVLPMMKPMVVVLGVAVHLVLRLELLTAVVPADGACEPGDMIDGSGPRKTPRCT